MPTNIGGGQIKILPGETLYGIYGANWKQASGYTGDPTKLQVGTILPAPGGGSTPTSTTSTKSTAPSQQNLQNPQDVTGYLQTYQQDQFNQLSPQPEVRGGSLQELIASGYGGYAGWGEAEALANFKSTGGEGKFTGATTTTGGGMGLPSVPTAPSFGQQYQELTQATGVQQMETQLNDLKAQQDELYASYRQQTTAERAKPVPMNVIAGRIGEEERTYLERNDYLTRQQSRLTDQINTAYKGIQLTMEFSKMDYDNAVQNYELNFNRAMKIYDIYQSNLDKQQATARANLSTIYNLMTDGNLKYSGMTSSQQLYVNKLEVQSGLPIGLVSQIQTKTTSSGGLKDPVIKTREADGVTYYDVLGVDSSGNWTVKSITGGATTTSGGTVAEQERQYRADMASALNQVTNDYGHVTPAQFTQARRSWVSAGMVEADFNNYFYSYASPDRSDFTQSYGMPRK